MNLNSLYQNEGLGEIENEFSLRKTISSEVDGNDKGRVKIQTKEIYKFLTETSIIKTNSTTEENKSNSRIEIKLNESSVINQRREFMVNENPNFIITLTRKVITIHGYYNSNRSQTQYL